MLNVEELESRIVLTPPKIAVPPVGTYPLKDAAPVAMKKDWMQEISADYDKDAEKLAGLKSGWHVAGEAFVTTMIVPLGAYVVYKTQSTVNALEAHMAQLDLDYWYLAQQVP